MLNLKSRFQQFIHLLPSVEEIDLLNLPTGEKGHKIADYFGLGRSVIFEQKTINKDQADKIQAEVELHSHEDGYPLFYGKRDINSVLSKLPNATQIKQNIFTKTTRLLEGYLRTANKQIASTSRLFGLHTYTGVLIILNDKVKVLSPQIIVSRIAQRLKQKDSKGKFRFDKITFVLLISETHLYKGETPTIILIEGPLSENCDKKASEYLDYITHSWAAFNGGGLAQLETNLNFFNHLREKEEPQPEQITRQEERSRWYRNNRYMRGWSDKKVLETGARLIETIKPFIIKGGSKIPVNDFTEMTFAFGDLIEESNYRGLDLKAMKTYFKKLPK